MQLTTVQKIADRPSADILVLPFWQGAKKAEPAFAAGTFKEELAPLLQEDDFKGKEGETALIYTGKKDERRLLLLGCGKKAEASDEILRKSVSSAVKLCRKKGWTSLSFICPEKGAYHEAITEGILLSNYVFDELKSEKEDVKEPLKKVCLVGVSKTEEKTCRRAETITDAVNFARDLINGNADDITPQKLSETARELCKSSKGLKATILGKSEITKAGLGLLLAVNRASFRDPALIIVEYRGNPSSKERTAIIGKGITYDTGGLILKPKGGMETMKDDMSGGAAVLGTLKALAALKARVNVIGVIPSTENSIGSKSYKPGDVYKSYSGKTVEVYDTDAEGRLVLADAISYVQDHYKPSRMIDLATLTGGIVVALGELASGLFSNDDKLAKQLYHAGEATHERLWRMPLFPEYKEALKSSIADIKNAADRRASSITGAIFIQSFVNKTPWAHLDIAGTAYLSAPQGYHSTPATGVGVRLLVEFFTKHHG
ncbi:MAG: leucyl aminopeptidase [Rhabdochlamydiaceae bacterium]|nr:leucyl aminopeptidase [Rhabdochlamydiaceae bacterium]